MPKLNLLPWRKEENKLPIRQAESDPFTSLQDEMNHMFDNFFNRSLGMRPFGFDEVWDHFQPLVNVVDEDKTIIVTAELPGLDEKEIELTLNHTTLQISGEKKLEAEKKGQNYYRMERSYGTFRRTIALPSEIDPDKVNASFQKGILTIVLPKIIEAKHRKRIPISK